MRAAAVTSASYTARSGSPPVATASAERSAATDSRPPTSRTRPCRGSTGTPASPAAPDSSATCIRWSHSTSVSRNTTASRSPRACRTPAGSPTGVDTTKPAPARTPAITTRSRSCRAASSVARISTGTGRYRKRLRSISSRETSRTRPNSRSQANASDRADRRSHSNDSNGREGCAASMSPVIRESSPRRWRVLDAGAPCWARHDPSPMRWFGPPGLAPAPTEERFHPPNGCRCTIAPVVPRLT